MRDERMTKKLGWVDLETTGLDASKGLILEVAVVVTDWDFNVYEEYSAVVDNGVPVAKITDMCDEYVTQMHTKNGLFERLAFRYGNGHDMKEVAKDVKAMFERHDAIGSPMAGSSLRLDRNFIDHHSPELAELFHYRSIDVSTLKELFKNRHGFEPEQPASGNDHRALSDIKNSIELMKQYVGKVV